MSLADLPDVLTIDEAAAVLRIGRGAAYELARQYLWSGGQTGLPVFPLGRRLRVPKVGLERLVASEPHPLPEQRLATPLPWRGRAEAG